MSIKVKKHGCTECETFPRAAFAQAGSWQIWINNFYTIFGPDGFHLQGACTSPYVGWLWNSIELNSTIIWLIIIKYYLLYGIRFPYDIFTVICEWKNSDLPPEKFSEASSLLSSSPARSTSRPSAESARRGVISAKPRSEKGRINARLIETLIFLDHVWYRLAMSGTRVCTGVLLEHTGIWARLYWQPR